MATLYIANTSKQHHQFMYRLPEQQIPRSDIIRIGAQMRIGDLSREQIDHIIKQHQRYGLKSVDELQRNRDYIGLLYSIDKPVPLNNERVLGDTFAHNDEVLNDKAKDRREEAAVAVAENIQNTMQHHGVEVPRAEVEVVEDTRGTPKVADGYEVVREGTRPRHEGRRSGRAERRAK